MGRKRNDEERNRIQNIAFNLFRTVGYDETSFTDIANATGLKRSLIQYYFPKKENLIKIYINKALDVAAELVEANPFVTDPIKKLHLIAYLEFMALYKDNQAEHLYKAILRDRDNTMMVFDRVIDWALEYLGSDDEAYNQMVREAIIYAAGGTVEYVYQVIAKGKLQETDPKAGCLRAIQLMDFCMDLPVHPIDLNNPGLEAWINENVKEINRRIYHL